MPKNLKKRILTSTILFIILILMFINNFVLGYFVLVAGTLSVIDFTKMIKKIFYNLKIKQLIFNLFLLLIFFLFAQFFLFFHHFFI